MEPLEGSREFVSRARAGGCDVWFVEYEGGFHALFADVGRERVLGDVAQGIDARVEPTACA
jgi:alpha-beta hydrolase superfamily lysophospholipase